MVNSILEPSVLCPFQLIISNGGDSLCSISFPHQSFDFRGEPGGLGVSNSLFLNWSMKVGRGRDNRPTSRCSIRPKKISIAIRKKCGTFTIKVDTPTI